MHPSHTGRILGNAYGLKREDAGSTVVKLRVGYWRAYSYGTLPHGTNVLP